MSSLKANIQIEPQDVFMSSTTQGTDLGAFATTGDGRGFRYVLNGAVAMVPGKLYQASAEDTTNFQNLTVAAVAVGATSMTTSTTVTLTANQLAGGFLTVTSASTGAGQTLKIKGNTAATAAVTTITLEDPVLIATTGTVKIDMVQSPYAGLILNPTTATSAAAGVAVSAIPAANYGWLQTQGPAAVLAQGTVVVGTQVASSSTTAGAIVATSGVLSNVGIALTGIATTEYGFIDLELD